MTDVFGPKVAIVDDVLADVEGIINYMENKNIGYKYFNADITQKNYPEAPIDTIDLVFLDLYYSAQFNPYHCAQWINSIIPSKKLYELIVWSKDSHKTDELLGALTEIEKAPRNILTKQKTDFMEAGGIEKLITEIKDFQETSAIIEEFIAEIIEVEEDYVVLNCLVDKDTQFYQIRRFDKTPLRNFKNLSTGSFLIVRITTEPGERRFEFIEEFTNHRELFEQKNIFLKFKDGPFFKPSR